MRFLFTCGGTAGHINPALALADELRRLMPDCKLLFIGSGRRMENKLIPQAGYDLKNIKISGFERGFTPDKIMSNIKTLRNIAVSSAQTAEIITQFKPDVVIGTGGYVCYPVLKKAAQCGIPTLLHESNAVPGLTTKMLSRIVDKILVAFPGVEKQYSDPERVIFTGTPVRGGFLDETKQKARMRLGIDGRPLVVSFWGSLGAEKMNDIILDVMSLNLESRLFNHIHATGGSEATTAAFVVRLGEKNSGTHIPEWIDIRTYIDNMPAAMAAADLILCRGGASTMAELTLMGKPAVIIPSPNVTNNHQEKNAVQLAKLGGAQMLREKDCSGEKLYQTVSTLLTNKTKLLAMAEAMKRGNVQDATQKITEMIISMCH